MGRRSRVAFTRARDARRWLRSRGPVTLAAGLLLEVSSATTPGSSRARSLARAALLGLVLLIVLIAAVTDSLLSRLVDLAAAGIGSIAAWSREHVLGQALPAPIHDELLRDRSGRPLRGSARTARVSSIQRERAKAARARSLRARTERALAWLSKTSSPYTRHLVRAGLATERRVLALRARVLAATAAGAARIGPRLDGVARAGYARSLSLGRGLARRAADAAEPARAVLAREGRALPGRAERALRRGRAATALAYRTGARALAAIPIPAIPLPALSLRTVRVVTAALMLSFVFATAIGTTGLVATRGSVALGASTTLGIISGEVQVSDAGASELRPAVDGEVLQAGVTIKTGPDAYAILTYFEGSTVSIDPNTVLVIESLLANPDGSTIIGMRQDVGQTWHAVTKLLTAGSKYEVRTPTATATVRGTLFLVGVLPGAATDALETVIETTEGAVGAVREPTDDTPEGEEVVVPAGFQVRSKPAEALPPPVPAPEPERKVTVTVGAANSLVVDPQGRANGEKDGKIVVQTPGAKVEKVDGQIVVTMPNTTDGKISTVIQQAKPDDDAPPPAPVQITTVVQERGRGESRTEETVQPTTQAPTVTGVEIKKSSDAGAPAEVRQLDESEKKDAPKVKVAEAPPPPVPPVARQEEPAGGDSGKKEEAPAPSGDAERTSPPRGGVVNTIVTLTLPPLSAEEVAKREAEKREQEDRDRRDREQREEERRREDERRIAELRRAEDAARAEASRIGGEREREETKRSEERSGPRTEEPAPSPAGVIEQIFRAVGGQSRERDADRRVEDLRQAEQDAQKKAEGASEERRRAEQRNREDSIKAEEEKKKDAERRTEELRRAEERAKREEERRLEELRKIDEKAREQTAKLETEQRREAERRLEEFRQAEERKRREEARALEEQRLAEERTREESERRLQQLRREEEQARESERERDRERERERERDRDRGRRGFTPTETLRPLPGVGSRSIEEEEQRTLQLEERQDQRERARDTERRPDEQRDDAERQDREGKG